MALSKERRARLNEARRFAGYRSAHFTRSTGTMVVVLDGIEADLDTDGGRWQTVCDDHGAVCSHLTLAVAMSFAPAPEEWCEWCMGNIPAS